MEHRVVVGIHIRDIVCPCDQTVFTGMEASVVGCAKAGRERVAMHKSAGTA